MPIIYSFSTHQPFRERRECSAGAKRGRSQNRAQRRVKHTERLVQKNFSQEACKRDLGDRFRHESSESRRSDSPNPARRRTTEDTRDAFARPFSFLHQQRQTPSLRLSNSLTVCGLALPPDAFMT